MKENGTSRWNLLRHPTERGEGRSRFDLAAEIASNLASSSLFFSVCLLTASVWAVGLVVGLPSETESDLTGAMAAMTLLLVALLKNSERRAERAMQLKLDAIAAALLQGQPSRKTPYVSMRRSEPAIHGAARTRTWNRRFWRPVP